MKVRPIHENLDTAFVNLSALVRYLRRRQFEGCVRVELSGYEADIHLSETNGLRAREHDLIAGRVAEGEEALQRILIRSREPGGIVNVYQAIAATENESLNGNNGRKKAVEAEIKQPAPVKIPPQPQVQELKIVPLQTASPGEQPENLPLKKDAVTAAVTAAVETAKTPKPKINLPNFPFELSNRFEDRAKRAAHLSPGDWQMLLNLAGELLETVNRSLAEANLNFPAAFQKARTEISPDYPFLKPAAEIFEFKDGKISMREQTSAKLFTASIIESLRRILEKLGANPKFSAVHRQTTQKILALINHRKPLYDKFSITKPLEKVLGV